VTRTFASRGDGSSGLRRYRAHVSARDGSWTAAVVAIAVRPWLWRTAVSWTLRAAPAGWWRRPPFVPRPDHGYLSFRLETQYGGDRPPVARDLVSYLEWCRAQREIMRRGRP
jgi:hypothetical protein